MYHGCAWRGLCVQNPAVCKGWVCVLSFPPFLLPVLAQLSPRNLVTVGSMSTAQGPSVAHCYSVPAATTLPPPRVRPVQGLRRPQRAGQTRWAIEYSEILEGGAWLCLLPSTMLLLLLSWNELISESFLPRSSSYNRSSQPVLARVLKSWIPDSLL